MADAPYISPIPAEFITDYRVRIAGAPIRRRVHIFRDAGGRALQCLPEACRECWREREWRAGQVRG